MAGVMLEPVSVAATPGGMATCSVKIRNTGVVVDAFTVTVLGDAAAWATVMPAQLSLFPGSDGTVEVQFSPPRSSSLAAGPIDFGVRVAASEDPDGSVVEEGVLQVAAFSELNAKLTPRTSEAKRSARHEVLVDNRGNAAIEVTLAASDPDELLAFEVKPPSLTVGAGQTGRASVKVIAVKGAAKHRPFEVMVTASGAGVPPVRLDGAMVQKSGTPRFLFPLIALAVAAAVIVLVLPAMLTKKDGTGTLRLTNEQATTTVPAGDDEAAAAAQAAKDKADAEAAAAAERAANGKDPSAPGAAAGAGATAGAAGAATSGAAASSSSGGGTTDVTEVTTPNAAPPPPPGATTTAPTATTVPSSTGSVRGTFSFDFDTGAETATGADAFWQQSTSTSRSFVPQNGAQFSPMGAADYEATDKAKLQSLTYSTAAIDGSDANNKLTPGTVVAIKTSNGRYAKMKVISKAADNTLTFRFYTYP
jgi:hypothetical protein